MLIAADDYNMYYNASQNFADPESSGFRKSMLPARQLAIVDAVFDGHLNPRLAYGTFIGATTQSQSVRSLYAECPEEVRKTWISVAPYSRQEFDNVISHYQFCEWVRNAMPLATREYVYQLTSGVGSDFWAYSQKL